VCPSPITVPDWDEISPSPTGMKSPRPRPRSRAKNSSHTRPRAATSTLNVNYKRKGDQTIGEESSALAWRRGSWRAVRGRATPTCLTEAARAARWSCLGSEDEEDGSLRFDGGIRYERIEEPEISREETAGGVAPVLRRGETRKREKKGLGRGAGEGLFYPLGQCVISKKKCFFLQFYHA
jgi:hypothetical protein